MDKKDLMIDRNASILDALSKISQNGVRELIVVDNYKKLLGVISDGDIRKFIVKKNNLETSVFKVMNKKPFFIYKEKTSLTKLNSIDSNIVSLVPLLNRKNIVEEIISPKTIRYNFLQNINDNNVIIMSGGYGKRMHPFTKVLPKALLPVGKKTLIQIIIDNFIKYNFCNITICVNYKKNFIKNYIESLNYFVNLNYINEKKSLGTIGGLSLLKLTNNLPIIVVNCDTIINYNYKKILNFHKKSSSDLTILLSKESIQTSYGVCKISNKKVLKEFVEKPTFSFLANIGMYVINQNILNLIPKNKKFDFNSLVKKIMSKTNYKIMTYTVSNKDYFDFGIWDNFEKSTTEIKKII